MTNPSPQSDRERLRALAIRAMRERGLDPDFSHEELAEAAAVRAAPATTEEPVRDERALLWCSIDNDDSRDLDQLSVAEALPGGDVRVLVAIADVDVVVVQGLAGRSTCRRQHDLGLHAGRGLSDAARAALDRSHVARPGRGSAVGRHRVRRGAPDGALRSSDIYGARVRNHAKLAYNSVDAWLTGRGPLPDAAAATPGIDAQLKLQDGVAQALGRQTPRTGSARVHDDRGAAGLRRRHAARSAGRGAESREGVDREFHGRRQRRHRAVPRRARLSVDSPRREDAGPLGPHRRDRRAGRRSAAGRRPMRAALNEFLLRRRAAEPDTFPELSQTIIKLLGSGEYVVDPPGGDPPGHFGLAVKDYAHSTAPNRRYPDLLTQRLIKAALAGHPCPYALERARAAGGALHDTGRRGEQSGAAGEEIGRRARRGLARRARSSTRSSPARRRRARSCA